MSQLLNDPQTQQNPQPKPTFPIATNYNHPQEDPYRHFFVAAIDYYQPQQELYRHLVCN